MLAQTAPPPTSSTTLIVVIIAVLILVAVIAFAASKRRSAAMHQRFGQEYDRTVAATGSRERAEKELAGREQRVRKLHIQPLPAGARDRYSEEWRTVQADFVDKPAAAVAAADRLVTSVMRDRGYPTDDPEQRIDDLTVEHANVTNNYRIARTISARNERGEATTEDLRTAMVSYRALFTDLLGADPVANAPTKE